MRWQEHGHAMIRSPCSHSDKLSPTGQACCGLHASAPAGRPSHAAVVIRPEMSPHASAVLFVTAAARAGP
jgi:hypothetical protein